MIAVSASFDKSNQISFPSYEKFLAKSNVMHHFVEGKDPLDHSFISAEE